MRVSSARMLRIVAGAGSRPVRRCTACWICWHQSLPGIASSETGACPGWPAMTSPSRRTSMLSPGVGIVPPRPMIWKMHQATSRRIGSGRCDRSTPARQVPSWQNAPAYCGGTVSGAKRDSRICSGTAAHKVSSACGSARPRAASISSSADWPRAPVTSTPRPARRRGRSAATRR